MAANGSGWRWSSRRKSKASAVRSENGLETARLEFSASRRRVSHSQGKASLAKVEELCTQPFLSGPGRPTGPQSTILNKLDRTVHNLVVFMFLVICSHDRQEVREHLAPRNRSSYLVTNYPEI